MRLAIVRQRYTPFGGAERFIENALEALLERNVAITLYTREWPETNVQLMEPQIVDPFHRRGAPGEHLRHGVEPVNADLVIYLNVFELGRLTDGERG